MSTNDAGLGLEPMQPPIRPIRPRPASTTPGSNDADL